MKQKWVESSRGRTHYWIARRPGAPVLVFLHGLAADHTLFERQMEYFRDRYTLLAWDCPAQGASRPYGDFTLLHCAVELKRILDAEEIARCVMIGHSLGALVAQSFIAHWPDRVRGFVGVGALPLEKKYYAKGELKRLVAAGRWAKWLPFRLLHWGMAHASGRSFYTRANMRMSLEGYSRRQLCALLSMVGKAIPKELVEGEEIPCPAMLLVGEKDRTKGLRARLIAWHKETGMPLYRVRAAGHNANADKPKSVNRLLHAFFNSLPGELRVVK